MAADADILKRINTSVLDDETKRMLLVVYNDIVADGQTHTGPVTGNVTGNVTGYIILPTSDPAVVGALWNNAGVVTISAGP